MLSTLTLVLALAPPGPSSVRLLDAAPTTAFRTSTLLAQAEAFSAADAALRIVHLNKEIADLRNDWPVGAIVLAYVGFSTSPVALVGLVLLLLSSLGNGGSAGAVLGGAGIGATVIGLVGLGLGIAGLVYGFGAAEERRERRLELIRERDTLQRQLDEQRTRPTTVDRGQLLFPLTTLATF